MPSSNNTVAGYFNNLPMEYLISAPLTAVADSNKALAGATYEFINEVWLDPKDKTTRTLTFNLHRMVDDGTGTLQLQAVKVEAPFAALAQLPNLMVKTVDIEFTMEVKDTVKREDTHEEEAQLTSSAKIWKVTTTLSGSVTASSTNTRQTDQSAKYDVRVHTEQAPPTEGINKLGQIFASCIEPYKAST
jgi:hypothetical protein